MKDITTSTEVRNEIQSLIKQLHTLCETNNVPMLACVVLEKTETEDSINIQKALSAFIDESTGAFDSTLAAASEILRLHGVPDSVIYMLSALRQSVRGEDDEPVRITH